MARRVAQAIIDEIAEEYTSGQLKGLYRRLRRRAEKAARMAEKRARAACGPDGTPLPLQVDNNGKPVELPADVTLAQNTRTQVDVEEAITRIRERHIKTIGPAQALLDAIVGSGRVAETAPRVVIREAQVDSDDGASPKPPSD